jgi:hypothetical protein
MTATTVVIDEVRVTKSVLDVLDAQLRADKGPTFPDFTDGTIFGVFPDFLNPDRSSRWRDRSPAGSCPTREHLVAPST